MSAAAAVPTRAELLARIDRSPDLAYSLTHLAAAFGQLGLLLALLPALPPGPLSRLGFVLAMGWTQYRMYFPLHEAAHGTLLRSPRANRAVGRVCAGVLFTSFRSFTDIHMEHHRLWGSREDPGALDYFVRFGSRGRMAAFFLAPLVGATLFAKLWQNLAEPLRAGRRGRGPAGWAAALPWIDLFSLAGVQGALLLLATGGLARPFDYLWAVLLPGATVFLFLARLRMYLEHGPVDYAVSDYLGDNARRIARSHASGWLERPLFSYMNFRLHQEHHLFPSLPSARLPEVERRFTRGRLHPDDLGESYLGTLRRISRLP